MAKSVFILGAGASAESGAPVMSNFLDRADELRKAGNLTPFQADFDRVFKAISELQVVHSKAELNLDNLESVFGTFEMARMIRRFPGFPEDQVGALMTSFTRMIVKTLVETIRFEFNNGRVFGSRPHVQLAELIAELSRHEHRCAVITFNYDLVLDYALHHSGYPADYYLEENIQGLRTPLLKLHGSLNWARCRKCDLVIPWRLENYFKRRNWNLFGEKGGTVKFSLGSDGFNGDFAHCDQEVEADPVIVPPTWSKGAYHSNLAAVWRQAALELSDAENVFVCGYSLTETDSFFRYLFALGSVGLTRIKRFWVYDLDSSGEVERRFRKLLGPGAESRFRSERRPFKDFAEVVGSELLQ